ncbi:MAG: PhoU domain-containing protein [Candidatus Bathyarchaeia archaeon]
METRKLQKLKGGSYIISLPKEFVEKYGLSSGVKIAISEEPDGSLRLFPSAEGFEKTLETTVSLEDYPDLRSLKYCLVTYYIQGVDRINVISRNIITAEQKRQIKQLRAELPGVEVAEEEANKLTFQIIIDPTVFSIESLIEKIFTFSLKLQEDLIKALANFDLQLAMEVLERSNEAQRHYRFTIRLVATAAFNPVVAKKLGVKGCPDAINFTLVVRDLSRLIYYSSSIASHILELEGRKVEYEILNLLGKMLTTAYEMQKTSMEAFMKKNVNSAIKVFGRMNEIRELEKVILKRIMEKITNIDLAITLSMIARDTRRMAGHAVAISDDVMNRVLRPKFDLI